MFKIYALFFIGLCSLSGCAVTPDQAALGGNAASANFEGGLLMVRLVGATDPPNNISVETTRASGAESYTMSGRLYQQKGTEYADYLLALALPSQTYTIKSVSQGLPEKQGMLITKLEAPLLIKPQNPSYLGRLIIDLRDQNSQVEPELSVEDHFEADTSAFLNALMALKGVEIAKDLIKPEALALHRQHQLKLQFSLKLQEQDQAGAQLAPRLEVSATGKENLNFLVPAARSAYAKFLTIKTPRAFAISADGKTGVGKGEQAIASALKSCAGTSSGTTCRVIAVDNTFLTPIACVYSATKEIAIANLPKASQTDCANQAKTQSLKQSLAASATQ